MTFNLKVENDDARHVFITGNFNHWHPADAAYRMEKLAEGRYSLIIPDEKLPEEISFKFTKGGWENVELDGHGDITPNRKTHKSHLISENTVPRWRLNWGPFKPEYAPVAELVAEKFYIPQLDRHRKVWALLPHDYYETEKSYPVLYLQDAQNLFNEGSQFGNWEIDKKLSVLAEYGRGDLIVVAVDHGDEERINEYIFDNDAVAQGSAGKKYIRFITDTLKPYIDAHYRTKKDRENTGIGGSSLGGLISIYSGFLYPEVYSKLMIFSPSLWVEPENNFPLIRFRKPYKIKIYIYGGEKEGAKMVKRIRHFEENLSKWEYRKLFDFEFRTSINPEGSHNEFYWSQEFPRAVEWLYFDTQEDPKALADKSTVKNN